MIKLHQRLKEKEMSFKPHTLAYI